MENNQQEQSGFSYTYSARQQAEVKKIREKYTMPTQDESKMERLRRLDASVGRTARSVSLVFGVIGTLVLGFGMSLCMTDFGAMIGLYGSNAFIAGITLGIVGGVLAGLAYPVYQAIVKARRKKLAPEILRLSDELLK